MSIPTNYLTATGTQALLASKQVTINQIIHDHQARYRARDSDTHAWVTTNFEGALAKAEKEDTAGLPLHGVVIGVKDIISAFLLLGVVLLLTQRHEGYAH
jgi:Asp-tRNA(Asn)/Glu-tRNA(Gln) amidotransferase A subunit family amidase